MMAMLYRPSYESYKEDLEQETYALCRKLSLQSKGNPTKFIEDLRAQLLDANTLGVKLKWIVTGKTVVTNMAKIAKQHSSPKLTGLSGRYHCC